MKRALIVLADGFEEIEAVTPIDLLRRAGIEVIVAGLGGLTVVSKRRLKVTCDVVLDGSHRDWDVLILPGGRPGADNLARDAHVQGLLSWGFANQKWVAAICASPAVVLGSVGWLSGRRYTGFPGTESPDFGGTPSTDAVVVDGRLVTSRGAGTSAAFAFAIIAALLDQAAADKIAAETLY